MENEITADIGEEIILRLRELISVLELKAEKIRNEKEFSDPFVDRK